MAKTIGFNQLQPPTIQVDLSVARMRIFDDDGVTQIWGHVGDYEVAVYLPLTDQRVRELLNERQGEHANGVRPS